jgi:heat shock protein HslJ
VLARAASPVRRLGWAAPVLALTVLLATQSSSGSASPGGPASPRPVTAAGGYEGAFTLASLTVGGSGQPLAVPVHVELDPVHGQLTIDTGCNTKLGSFSLLDDGRAGVTVAGGTELPCTAGPGRQEARLLAVLAEVSSWRESGAGLVLQSAGGGEVELAR